MATDTAIDVREAKGNTFLRPGRPQEETIMKAYRVTVTIETFENEKDLLSGEANSIRKTRNFATSTDGYFVVEDVMSKALSQLDEDTLNGSFWEG